MLQWCYQHLYFAISGVAYYSCFPFPSAWNRLVLGNVVLSGDDSNSQAGYLSEHFLILSSSWANWDSTPFLSAFRFFISTFTRAICSLSRAYWKKHNVATSENITITEIMLLWSQKLDMIPVSQSKKKICKSGDTEIRWIDKPFHL